jgi:hypothetical protein
MIYSDLRRSITYPSVFRTDSNQLIFDEDSVRIRSVDIIDGVLYFLIELDEYSFSYKCDGL